jgi:hypothetical protein
MCVFLKIWQTVLKTKRCWILRSKYDVLDLHWTVIVAVALMVLLVRELITRQVYTPEAFLKALSIVTPPATTLGMGISRGSRIWKVVMV